MIPRFQKMESLRKEVENALYNYAIVDHDSMEKFMLTKLMVSEIN